MIESRRQTVVRGSSPGPTSSYALHLTDDDELLHLHWGPRIALADAEALAAQRPARRTGRSSPSSTGTRSTRSRAAPASSARRCPCARDERARHRVDLRRRTTAGRRRAAAALHRRRARTRPHAALPDARRRRCHRALGHRRPTARGPAVELLRADSAAWTLPQRERWRLSASCTGGGRPSPCSYARSSPTARRSSAAAAATPGTSTCPGSRWTPRTPPRSTARSTAARSAGPDPGGSPCAQLPDGARADHRRRRATTTPGCCGSRPGESYTTPVFAGLWSDGGFGGASRAWHAYAAGARHPGRGPGPAGALQLLGGHRLRHLRGAAAGARRAGRGDGRRAVRRGRRLVRAAHQRPGRPRRLDPQPRPLPGRAGAARRRGARARHAVRDLGRAGDGQPDSDLYRAHPDWVQHHPGRTSDRVPQSARAEPRPRGRPGVPLGAAGRAARPAPRSTM